MRLKILRFGKDDNSFVLAGGTTQMRYILSYGLIVLLAFTMVACSQNEDAGQIRQASLKCLPTYGHPSPRRPNLSPPTNLIEALRLLELY